MGALNYFFDLLHQLLGDGLLYHGVMAAIGFLLILLAGKLLKIFLNTWGRRLITKTESDLDDKILEIILSRLMSVTAITGAYFGMRELRFGIGKGDGTINLVIDNANAVLFVLTAIIITIVLTRIASTIVVHLMKAYSERQDASLHRALTPLMNRVVMFVIAALAIIVVLDHFGQNVNSLLTLIGACSLALGLAAQDTLSNMISGFVIMIDRPFHIGDRIKIPTGEEGDVFEIGMRSTTILDFDHNLIVVPNNDLIRSRIVNYTYPSPEHRVILEINAAYGTDVDAMKHLMLVVARANMEVMLEPAPEVFLVNLGDSSLQFRLICRVNTFTRKFAVTEQLRVEIYKKMIEEKIEIPYPHYVIKLKDVRHAL
jgi:MscS family membrane protein